MNFSNKNPIIELAQERRHFFDTDSPERIHESAGYQTLHVRSDANEALERSS